MMRYEDENEEQYDEAIILEKLDAMEGHIKSLLSILEEPLVIKGARIPVRAVDMPLAGELKKWHKGHLGEVTRGEPLCEIKWGSSFGALGGTTIISAPATGILHIIVGVDEDVSPGQIVAEIEEVFEI
ncbi:MAG: hypothetical protein GY800_12845 [Planctomycetes bacterium]|nr:hypothetical protein [Planctomycetota bacterium]